jgi:signal transduction histidine kinase
MTSSTRKSGRSALAELRAAARCQAAYLRRDLSQLAGEQPTALAEAISEAVETAAARGLRVKVTMTDLADVELSRVRCDALRGAVQEALGNTVKHSGATEAVVRVADLVGGVQVVVRDHGRGFCSEPASFGFGIRESVLGRIGDAGGHASVESWPGRGTRVRLWMPA